jgi:hypothetical protein
MIIRNIDGNILIINRKDFKSDTLYHTYIYNIIIPFSNLYKNHFVINNIKNIKQ